MPRRSNRASLFCISSTASALRTRSTRFIRSPMKTSRALIDANCVRQHRERALSPDRPMLRGTAQNPDVFFQAREAINPFYSRVPHHRARRDGSLRAAHRARLPPVRLRRRCRTRSASSSSWAPARAPPRKPSSDLIARGEKVGLLKVRLFRPFDAAAFAAALPKTVRAIAVLDRTKEPGSMGEPLYLDVVTALSEAWSEKDRSTRVWPRIVGGRYGLSSKEFTPAMVKAVFDELSKDTPKNHFTIGINDDVTHTSLAFDPAFSTERPATRCARSSMAWARTAPSARTRTRSKSSAKTRPITRRDILCMTRRRRAR